MRWALVFLLVSVILSQVLAQDSTEDSPAPKRVLKKYRVRRPVVVDDQGNVVRAGPRLRRVRVKQPRPTVETAALQGNPPQAVSVQATVSSGPSRQSVNQPLVISTNPPRLRPTVQQQQQQPTPSPIAQTTQQPRVLQLQQSKLRQPEQVYLDDNVPQVIEQVRTVPTYRQATPSANRQALLANVNYKSRGVQSLEEEDDEDKQKVGTIRNYSHINEDGSFTFGYEAADGSFKEETRGIDCVVRGKYGYVDPDGVRREFEYVSGNPCDPNAPKEEEIQEDEEEDEGAAPPPRPLLRRVRPEISENQLQGLQQVREEALSQDQLNQFVRPVTRQRIFRPTAQPVTGRPRIRITTAPPTLPPRTETPALIIRERPVSRPLIYQDPNQSLESDGGNRFFNFDSEVQRLAQISRPISQPQPLYEQPLQLVQRHNTPTVATQPATQYFGNGAFQNFPTGRAATPTAPSPTLKSLQAGPNSVTPAPEKNPNFGRYRTELVYDPSTGHYTSVIVQAMPNSNQEIELTQKLRAFVEPQRSNQVQIQNFGQPQIQYYNNPSAQSASGQIDQFLSRNAYSQQRQQQPQQQQQPQPIQNLQYFGHHHQQQQPSPSSPPPQQQAAPQIQHQPQQQTVRQYQYPTQSLDHSSNPANGQIDAFLRSLNIAI